MNRRQFLKIFSSASAGFALDPEKLLWVPGRKTIFDLHSPQYIEVPFEIFSIPLEGLILKRMVEEGLAVMKQELNCAILLNKIYDFPLDEDYKESGKSFGRVEIREPQSWRRHAQRPDKS